MGSLSLLQCFLIGAPHRLEMKFWVGVTVRIDVKVRVAVTVRAWDLKGEEDV